MELDHEISIISPNIPNLNLNNINSSQQENSTESKLFDLLQKLWKNEKFCKELLPYDETTISAVINKLEKRVKKIIKFSRKKI